MAWLLFLNWCVISENIDFTTEKQAASRINPWISRHTTAVCCCYHCALFAWPLPKVWSKCSQNNSWDYCLSPATKNMRMQTPPLCSENTYSIESIRTARTCKMTREDSPSQQLVCFHDCKPHKINHRTILHLLSFTTRRFPNKKRGRQHAVQTISVVRHIRRALCDATNTQSYRSVQYGRHSLKITISKAFIKTQNLNCLPVPIL